MACSDLDILNMERGNVTSLNQPGIDGFFSVSLTVSSEIENMVDEGHLHQYQSSKTMSTLTLFQWELIVYSLLS